MKERETNKTETNFLIVEIQSLYNLKSYKVIARALSLRSAEEMKSIFKTQDYKFSDLRIFQEVLK